MDIKTALMKFPVEQFEFSYNETVRDIIKSIVGYFEDYHIDIPYETLYAIDHMTEEEFVKIAPTIWPIHFESKVVYCMRYGEKRKEK